MRTIEPTTKFKRDYKRELKSNPSLDGMLEQVLNLLVADTELPSRLDDHGLNGEWKGCRDCHIRPDLLLIYEKIGQTLRLMRLGSHSELFG